MRCSRVALVALLLLTLASGCSRVISTKPLGEPAPTDQAKDLAGIWLTEDGDPVFAMHIQDNELRIGILDWDMDLQEFVVDELTVFVTVDEGSMYLNCQKQKDEPVDDDAEAPAVEPEPGAEEPTYGIIRLRAMGENILLLKETNDDAFEKAVKEGRIDGEIVKDPDSPATTIVLRPSGSQLDDFVDPEKAAEQFEVDPLMILRRVKRG